MLVLEISSSIERRLAATRSLTGTRAFLVTTGRLVDVDAFRLKRTMFCGDVDETRCVFEPLFFRARIVTNFRCPGSPGCRHTPRLLLHCLHVRNSVTAPTVTTGSSSAMGGGGAGSSFVIGRKQPIMWKPDGFVPGEERNRTGKT